MRRRPEPERHGAAAAIDGVADDGRGVGRAATVAAERRRLDDATASAPVPIVGGAAPSAARRRRARAGALVGAGHRRRAVGAAPYAGALGASATRTRHPRRSRSCSAPRIGVRSRAARSPAAGARRRADHRRRRRVRHPRCEPPRGLRGGHRVAASRRAIARASSGPAPSRTTSLPPSDTSVTSSSSMSLDRVAVDAWPTSTRTWVPLVLSNSRAWCVSGSTRTTRSGTFVCAAAALRGSGRRRGPRAWPRRRERQTRARATRRERTTRTACAR